MPVGVFGHEFRNVRRERALNMLEIVCERERADVGHITWRDRGHTKSTGHAGHRCDREERAPEGRHNPPPYHLLTGCGVQARLHLRYELYKIAHLEQIRDPLPGTDRQAAVLRHESGPRRLRYVGGHGDQRRCAGAARGRP
jgi:hypothetical protein